MRAARSFTFGQWTTCQEPWFSSKRGTVATTNLDSTFLLLPKAWHSFQGNLVSHLGCSLTPLALRALSYEFFLGNPTNVLNKFIKCSEQLNVNEIKYVFPPKDYSSKEMRSQKKNKKKKKSLFINYYNKSKKVTSSTKEVQAMLCQVRRMIPIFFDCVVH